MYGYGTEYENETCMMLPFCYSERSDWCCGCKCGDKALRYFREIGTEVSAEAFWDGGGYAPGETQPGSGNQCVNCHEQRRPAPNFMRTPTRTWARRSPRHLTGASVVEAFAQPTVICSLCAW